MNSKKIIVAISLLISLFFIFTNSILAAETFIQEDWSLLEQAGKPIGYMCDRAWKNDDGFRYSSDGVIQMELAGKTTQTKIHMELAVDKKYYAKSLVSLFNTNGSQVNTTVKFEPKQATITITTPDGRDHQKTCALDSPIYFESSFVQSITDLKKLKVGSSFTGQAWDIANNTPEEYVITVDEAKTYEYAGKQIPVFLVVEKKDHGSKFLMDAQGDTYWGSIFNSFEFRKIERNEIPELKSATVDMLLIPGNQKVAHPLRSTISQITITWSDIPLSEFKLTDNRQKVLHSKKTANSQEAFMEIHQDVRDFTGKVTLPVKNPTLASFLTDSDYITPSLPEVKKLTKEILGTETDGWAATQKLVDWVYANIQPELCIETLTTEQILKVKKGKCTEFSILFAALARSAGLPTRLAIGERYINDTWVSHMWDEVWLGEWVAVDASFKEVAPDALLVKLIDGESVDAVKKLRIKLTGKLGMKIEDVKVTESSNPDQSLKTGINGQVYTNTDFNCQISAPDDWNLSETTQQGFPLVIMNEPSTQATGIFSMISMPVGTKAEQALTAVIPGLQKTEPKFTLISQESSTIGAIPAAVANCTLEKQNYLYHQQVWVIVNEDIAYLFVFVAPDNQWKDYEDSFQKIRDQFKLLNASK